MNTYKYFSLGNICFEKRFDDVHQTEPTGRIRCDEKACTWDDVKYMSFILKLILLKSVRFDDVSNKQSNDLFIAAEKWFFCLKPIQLLFSLCLRIFQHSTYVFIKQPEAFRKKCRG